MKKLAIAASIVGAFALGLSLDVVTYASPSSAPQFVNGQPFAASGIVLRLKELPYCFGFETHGHPGFFGGALSECDF